MPKNPNSIFLAKSKLKTKKFQDRVPFNPMQIRNQIKMTGINLNIQPSERNLNLKNGQDFSSTFLA